MAATLSNFAATVNVAIGGAFGAALRYQTGRAMTAWLGAPAVSLFPWATLAVNIVGSLLMGMLAGFLIRHNTAQGEQLRLLLGVGLLGGYTTFSAYSLELVLLVERGQYAIAALYAFLSVATAVSALAAGLVLMRAVA